MNALRLAALLIYSIGAFAFGAILLLWIRELGRVGWAGRRGRPDVDLTNGAIVSVSFLWFVANIAALLVELGTLRQSRELEFATIFLAFAFPPLIMHTAWAEHVGVKSGGRSRWWRAALWPAYIAAVAIPAWCSYVFANPQSGDALARFAGQLLGAGLSGLFIAAAAYSVALPRRRSQEAPPQRTARRTMTALYAVMVLLFLAIFAINTMDSLSSTAATSAMAVSVAARSLPLLFLFVSAYHENRFQFFDLFVKRGVSLLVTIAMLTLWFAALLPVIQPLSATWAAPWIFAIALVPLVVAMPFVYAALARELDRRWLGRQFSTVEAVTRFLGGLRSATSEDALVARAEEGLTEIFKAPAAVRLDESPAGFDVEHETRRETIRFLMGRRASDAPYFSQDEALLRTLADVFASARENVQLQQRRIDQEQRARELSLHASRSELKALRAQINPHFLFNALNAIAGLIHRDPALADRTVERLAEVFRYTLRGADAEWARLEDELEFVRAYLDVERARFGDRLEVSFDVAPAASTVRVPTMMVQTLVENAVKHGVSGIRGRAVVAIRASIAGERVVISVSDNGPGFTSTSRDVAAGRSGGYGLANVRERLGGYFGDAAQLLVERDAALRLTTVSIVLPLVTIANGDPQAVAR